MSLLYLDTNKAPVSGISMMELLFMSVTKSLVIER